MAEPIAGRPLVATFAAGSNLRPRLSPTPHNSLEEIHALSPDIAQGVHEVRSSDDVGAGDQGIMFGYATNESPDLMPLTSSFANRFGERLTDVLKEGICS